MIENSVPYIPDSDCYETANKLIIMASLSRGPSNQEFLECIADICATILTRTGVSCQSEMQVYLQTRGRILNLSYHQVSLTPEEPLLGESRYIVTDGSPEILRRVFFRQKKDKPTLSLRPNGDLRLDLVRRVGRQDINIKERREMAADLLAGYHNPPWLIIAK